MQEEGVAGAHLAQGVRRGERHLGGAELHRAPAATHVGRAAAGHDLGVAHHGPDVAQRRRVGEAGVEELREVVGEDGVGLASVGGLELGHRLPDRDQEHPDPGQGGGGAGLSAATIKRRLATVSSLYGYLVARGDVVANPVPRGLPTRKSRHRGERGVPLVRGVRRLPRILDPAEVEALMAALRTERDRAMVQAVRLGGLRRCEVLGLRLEDLRLGEWRVFVADGKGGHQRLVPVSHTFFATVARYLDAERPAEAATDRVFVALKRPRRGHPLSSEGLDEVLSRARERAGSPTALATSCATRASRPCVTEAASGGRVAAQASARRSPRSRRNVP